MNEVECPYREPISNKCAHRKDNIKTSKKRFCGYPNNLKCVYFQRWWAKAKKCKFEGLKPIREVSHE